MVRAADIMRQQSTAKELGTLGIFRGVHVNRAASDGEGGWDWGGSEEERTYGDAGLWLLCEGCGEGEELCIQDQEVWMATGHQGAEGAGLVRREGGAVDGCGCMREWLEGEERRQQRWEQKGSSHSLIAVLPYPSSQGITPPGLPVRSPCFCTLLVVMESRLGCLHHTVRSRFPRHVAWDRELTGWESPVGDCLSIGVELNGSG